MRITFYAVPKSIPPMYKVYKILNLLKRVILLYITIKVREKRMKSATNIFVEES